MSLFKARDWWQTQCGHGEEFDMYCLLVANVDNDPTGQVKIVTGSFSGYLRVYLPRDRGYKAEDLLLETELEGGAVLALAAGRFTGSGGLQLAVLHPRKLSVYSVVSQGGGSYMHLTRLYDHWLEHTAANMTYGPFNGVQGCDYICVQSYDGQLYFFEAEAQAFTRYLPNFLVPGPIAYVDVSDTFITCTAAMELEAYKYKVIAAASAEKSAGEYADWRVVLGEAAIDIRVGRFSQGLSRWSTTLPAVRHTQCRELRHRGARGKELDYDAIAREHRQLAQIPHRLDAPRGHSLSGAEGLEDLSSLGSFSGGKRLTIKLYLAVQGAPGLGAGGVENLKLSVTAPEPLTPVVSEIVVPHVSMDPLEPTVALVVLATGSGLPASATAMVVATYTTTSGEPRTQKLDLVVPLCAFCQVVPPVKSAEFKVTISTNRAPPLLGSLFEDVLAAASPGVAQDKNPAPLNQLDLLMNETYDNLMDLGSSLEAAQLDLAARGRRLSGCVQLLLLLVRWRFALNEAEFAVLRGCISPEVLDGSEVGWEETTEAAMTHLLRTCLAKSAKEQAVQVTPLAPVKDTQRLRKHISLVLERMARGMRLLAPGESVGIGTPTVGGQRPLYRDYSLADVPHAVPMGPPPVPGLAVVSEEESGGIGDIEDVNGHKCLVCPWHFYRIDVQTGDKYYQAMEFKNGKMLGGEWKRYVTLSTQPEAEVAAAAACLPGCGGPAAPCSPTSRVDSDAYAFDPQCGERVLNSPPSANRVRVHSVGADGRKPAGGGV
ncbi:Bardet-Biedl syndrome 9 [Volvox carteri f. nagariensis]|uniref:Bardet-Biedl syndrome 9 n=1 Tax=Volvox carteri f. nagariensis TaxID=3068 RepID=D8UFW5_VOLCA|nr:Bardet-Biedl syndrome 9 [Volvox carteri f. nagariensis]EFJ41408.1 Bardet-Biedl syndrome 9 [Volvox carteri f. nagariensis]|eukprot:XP_002957514.1 Bardet-Biedl syndrome 9 [Volvox carteri f. nagariensis]